MKKPRKTHYWSAEEPKLRSQSCLGKLSATWDKSWIWTPSWEHVTCEECLKGKVK